MARRGESLLGSDWLGLYIKGLKRLVHLCTQAGWLVRFTTISLIPTPQVKRVSSFQQLPVEFTEDYVALFRCAVESVSVKTSNPFLVH